MERACDSLIDSRAFHPWSPPVLCERPPGLVPSLDSCHVTLIFVITNCEGCEYGVGKRGVREWLDNALVRTHVRGGLIPGSDHLSTTLESTSLVQLTPSQTNLDGTKIDTHWYTHTDTHTHWYTHWLVPLDPLTFHFRFVSPHIVLLYFLH